MCPAELNDSVIQGQWGYKSLIYSNFFLIDKPGSNVSVTGDNTIPERGTTITLHCSIDASPKQTSVKWTKNGLVLEAKGRFGASSDQLLMTIQDLAVSDNGNYECVGVNSEGEGICHNPYQLTVVCKCRVYL